jgi:hypothetical protein
MLNNTTQRTSKQKHRAATDAAQGTDNTKASDLIPRREASRKLGNVCSHTLRRWELKGLLTPYKLSARRTCYSQSEVNALIEASRAAATPQPCLRALAPKNPAAAGTPG